LTTHVAYNGNNPERHRGFLRGLRAIPGISRFTYTLLDPFAARPRGRIDWDAFIDALVLDTDTIIDIDPDAGIFIDVDAARPAQQPDVMWHLAYDVPWSPALDAQIHDLMREHYSKK